MRIYVILQVKLDRKIRLRTRNNKHMTNQIQHNNVNTRKLKKCFRYDLYGICAILFECSINLKANQSIYSLNDYLYTFMYKIYRILKIVC